MDRKPSRFPWRGRHIGAGLLIFFLALTALAVFFPGSWLRALINDRGSSSLGRAFHIDGDLTWRWRDGHPFIHAERLRLANTPDAKEPDMMKIAALDVTLDVWRTLRGRLTIPKLKLDGLNLILEKTDEDHKNWDMPALSQGKAVTNAALPQNRRQFPAIGLLEIHDSTLAYRDHPQKLDLKLKIDTVSGSSGSEDRGLTLSGQGTLQDKNFEVKAAGGSIAMLRDSGKAYPLAFAIRMGDTLVDVNGAFTDPVQMSGIDAALNLKGGNMADLFYLTGIPLPPTPAYQLAGALRKKGDVWSYDGFKGTVGKSGLAGDLTYDASGKRSFIKAGLTSDNLNLIDLEGFIGLKPRAGEAGQPLAPDQLIPDVPLNLGRLRAADMDISLKAKKFTAPGWPLEDMEARFDLKEGLLRIDPLRFGVSGGTVEGALTLDGRQDVPDVHMDLKLKKLSLKGFFDGTRFESVSSGRFGGHIDLKGKGRSLAQVLGDSDGRLTVIMTGGQISLLLIEAAGIDIAKTAPLLLGPDKTTGIRCGIGDFGVKSGMLTSDIFVFDTTVSQIKGDARINLKDQTIDARIEAHPKEKSPLAARTPITIAGPLKKPSVGLDPKEAAARVGGSALLSTLLTPIIGIIPFIELGLGKDSDCRGLIAEARAHQEKDAGR
jgi:uncharacterized protein involved in outer membrane biogenesis